MSSFFCCFLAFTSFAFSLRASCCSASALALSFSAFILWMASTSTRLFL
eukprot:CAMPEP_0197885916 /NCGR_PEP_ID=MMETSP1439-20131203/15453_1 /TAXON_ID=66791 /ORGANISM="Gonyaulax spinifera, Strain CCMP409" /LENGTH=48 /DNA_ID= /DNA_START= /DNA_END= /DNA_ORIENTATION=